MTYKPTEKQIDAACASYSAIVDHMTGNDHSHKRAMKSALQAAFAVEEAEAKSDLETLSDVLDAKRKGWQPIETAPKDEWMWVTRDFKHVDYVKQYNEDEGIFFNERSWESGCGSTHWMPLPSPPRKENNE